MNLKAFLQSKKAKAFIMGLVALFASKVLELPESTTSHIVQLVSVYLGAQGIADLGKGKTEAESGLP